MLSKIDAWPRQGKAIKLKENGSQTLSKRFIHSYRCSRNDVDDDDDDENNNNNNPNNNKTNNNKDKNKNDNNKNNDIKNNINNTSQADLPINTVSNSL